MKKFFVFISLMIMVIYIVATPIKAMAGMCLMGGSTVFMAYNEAGFIDGFYDSYESTGWFGGLNCGSTRRDVGELRELEESHETGRSPRGSGAILWAPRWR